MMMRRTTFAFVLAGLTFGGYRFAQHSPGVQVVRQASAECNPQDYKKWTDCGCGCCYDCGRTWGSECPACGDDADEPRDPPPPEPPYPDSD